MIQIIKASKCSKMVNYEMSKLFVYSFFDLFSSFCNDKVKLSKAFKHIFDMDKFYVVLLDGEVIGIGSVSDGSSTINFSKFKLCRYLGLKTGKNIFNYLTNIIVKRDYDFDMDNECGMVEFIAVKEQYRNKKVGYTLVNHIMCDNKYVRYLAKVPDNNYSGKNLFEKIGFEEFHLEEATNKEKVDTGVDNYIYMIYQKN